jgi:hypothetical protein
MPAAKKEATFEPRRAAAGQKFEYAAGGQLHRFSADDEGIVRPANDAEAAIADRFGLPVARKVVAEERAAQPTKE